MMLDDKGGNDGTWDVGDSILFTLWDVAALGISGDCVYAYTAGGGAGSATALFHGGYFWEEGWNGGVNIDALEAVSTVPEPTTFALLGIGLAGLGGGYLRRRRKQRQVDRNQKKLS